MSHIILYFLIDQSLHEDNAIATPPAVQEASDRSSLHLSSSLHILNRYMPDELYRHWLSGMVRCSSCGKTLASQRIHSPKGDYIIFQCGGYTRGICHTSHYVREKVLERAVIADLEEVIQLGTVEFTIRQPGPDYTSQSDLVNAQIKKINSKLERVRDSYLI